LLGGLNHHITVLNGSKPIWSYGPDYCTRNREAQQQSFVADFYTWENDAERMLITCFTNWNFNQRPFALNLLDIGSAENKY